MIYYFSERDSFDIFKKRKEQIGVLNRKSPKNCMNFFKKLLKTPFSLSGIVSQKNTRIDIEKHLKHNISKSIQYDSFYDNWLNDMSEICKMFCIFQKQKKVSFWLGSDRGCKRYHVDMVPFRLLVTYSGQGTELLPNEAADRNAFIRGESNEKIVRDKSKLMHLSDWDISIFRGGKSGILHRTPNSALEGKSSVLMRLDHEDYLTEIYKINGAYG